VRFYSMACRYGDYVGCNNLGVNEEVAGNLNEAKKWYRFSCDKGVAQGCQNSGLHAKREGRIKDSSALFAKAEKILKAGCPGGTGPTCAELRAFQARLPASGPSQSK